KTAHVHADEGGAPEKVAGIKLLPIATTDGKLTPDLIAGEAWGFDDEHRAQPLVVYLTQSSELGTVYTPDEVRAITSYAHQRGMRVFMDGARLSNAAATLGLPLRDFTTDAGVDVVTFGGTKTGALGAEAVVVLDVTAAGGLIRLRKSMMQLASKMRFVSAQLIALLDGDLYLRTAGHANAMATRLRGQLEAGIADGRIRGVEFTQPTQANAVFARLPAGIADRLRESFRFYDWDAASGEVRWVCSFDTQATDVDAFVAETARLTASV
ncbi:MAG TPA: beta-eliminating lyase-related protein, partial [Mycobacterium sp.]|nr:beta-eliminating lyase-related protein [Mycobacterium sp.]